MANTVNDSILVVEGDTDMEFVASSVALGVGVKEELVHEVVLIVLVTLAV